MPYDEYDPYSQFSRIMDMNNLFAPAERSNDIYRTTGFGSPYESSNASTGRPNQYDPYNYDNRMADLYRPRTRIGDMYARELENIPRREQPGLGRNILGLIAGLGAGVRPSAVVGGQPVGFEGDPLLAMKTADAASNFPYYTKLKDYDTNIDNLARGAAEEDRYNSNERINANNIWSRQNQERNIQRQEFDSKTRKQRADVHQWKAEHPDWEIEFPKGGFMTGYDPVTHKATIIRDADGNPIPSGTMDRAEELKLMQKNALERIDRQGDVTAGNILLRGEQDWETFNAEDPETGRMTAYEKNKATGQIRKVQIPGTVYRPGVKPAPRQPSQTDITVTDPTTGKPTYTEQRKTTYGEQGLPTGGKIKVKRKSDGKIGTISEKYFDPNTYEKVGQ